MQAQVAIRLEQERAGYISLGKRVLKLRHDIDAFNRQLGDLGTDRQDISGAGLRKLSYIRDVTEEVNSVLASRRQFNSVCLTGSKNSQMHCEPLYKLIDNERHRQEKVFSDIEGALQIATKVLFEESSTTRLARQVLAAEQLILEYNALVGDLNNSLQVHSHLYRLTLRSSISRPS
ncbi:hypothetical protein BJ508DRAFT_107628 [Ascobolus immersus RN42]|uniref:Uncharacterized protein n=1 Tax=Ascobolus immersus RN42 TaxID=1160509 RepID=A0A3N4I6Y0_ASCIM|nr:hypothetical protein BJ508DRAFT_107628 [Ascobolus immersus RN42]